MITMDVEASISKRGVDTSTTASSLPPTTEKKVATQVRTYSGSPVILSGLYRWDTTTTIQKLPILGDIPVLGLLFQKRIETKTKSEVVVYIMPHVEFEGNGSINTRDKLEFLYRHRFLPALGERKSDS
jgi:type II secretory pathway component GspD/PulD (secretin)